MLHRFNYHYFYAFAGLQSTLPFQGGLLLEVVFLILRSQMRVFFTERFGTLC